MDASLRILTGPFAGQTRPVLRKLLIGRELDCDLRLDSDFVSGYHCVLLLDDYTLRIRDLGSKNGTFVNGRQIGTSMLILLHDDTISIGEVNILIDLNAATRTPSPHFGTPPQERAAGEATASLEGDTVEHDGDVQSRPLAPPPHIFGPAAIRDVIPPSSVEP